MAEAEAVKAKDTDPLLGAGAATAPEEGSLEITPTKKKASKGETAEAEPAGDSA